MQPALRLNPILGPLALFPLLFVPTPSPAQEVAASDATSATALTVDREATVFAVVTHKAGLAAGKAHEHVVTPSTYDAELSLDPGALAAASFRLAVAATDLEVDENERVAALGPRLLEVGALHEAATVPNEKDRGKIRRSMLDDDQLDAAGHPTIVATARGLRAVEGGEGDATHVTTVALTVRGRTVEKEMPVLLRIADGGVEIEGTVAFAFADFGIEPYSAFLGLVKVADEFHAYVRLVARSVEQDSG